jgi:hypothetical protein
MMWPIPGQDRSVAAAGEGFGPGVKRLDEGVPCTPALAAARLTVDYLLVAHVGNLRTETIVVTMTRITAGLG